MAPLTDATLADFSALASESTAEVQSLTSGSGSDGLEPITRAFDGNHHSSNVETGVRSAADIPFEVTKESSRKIAELTSEDEYSLLVSQRRALVHKQLEGNMTRDEILQLRLI